MPSSLDKEKAPHIDLTSSHRMYQLHGSGKALRPRNPYLIVDYHLLKQQVNGFVGELSF